MSFLHLQICQNRSKEQRTGIPIVGDIPPDTSAVRFIGKQGRGEGCWSLITKVANPLGRNSKLESVPAFILHLHNVFVCLFVFRKQLHICHIAATTPA